MKYNNVIKGKFINRPNRFIAVVEVDGKAHSVHVKNTGRCKELLVPGSTVYLETSDNPERKTKYDIIAVEKRRKNKPDLLINMDSQVVNAAAGEWLHKCPLFSENALVRREVAYGNSRFDFYIEDGNRKAFLEVKGVTLELDGVAMFPDAPTVRGVKHINELIECVHNGYEGYILFVVQMKDVVKVKPNDDTHKEFGEALRKAHGEGVNIIAVNCNITKDSIQIDKFVDVDLS